MRLLSSTAFLELKNMLRRHRQLRTQINQMKDAGIFCLALWLAYWMCAELDWSFIGWEPVVVTAGGFSSLRRATQTPFNLVLEARP